MKTSYQSRLFFIRIFRSARCIQFNNVSQSFAPKHIHTASSVTIYKTILIQLDSIQTRDKSFSSNKLAIKLLDPPWTIYREPFQTILQNLDLTESGVTHCPSSSTDYPKIESVPWQTINPTSYIYIYPDVEPRCYENPSDYISRQIEYEVQRKLERERREREREQEKVGRPIVVVVAASTGINEPRG